ncbi:MAG: serine hydrolase [Acidimicrobiales bacterium]
MTTKSRIHAAPNARVRRPILAFVALIVLTTSVMWLPAGASAKPDHQTIVADSAPSVVPPNSPVGRQLSWLLGIGSLLPLSKKEEASHFDAPFIAAEPVAQLNTAFASLGSTGSRVTLLGLGDVTATTLKAAIKIGAITYNAQLTVDAKGLIEGLYFTLAAPIPIPKVTSWSQVDKDLAAMAPDSSFLAAQLNANGTCTQVHPLNANTPRPLGSMFKLFILGALASAVKNHTISWSQKLTLTAALKVGGSGVLQDDHVGTTLSVKQAAIKMISVSDNTAADMLLALVGRSAVEAQVRNWSSHASLDQPFLSVAELFVLKWHDFPSLANHYLSLKPAQRLAYLSSTVDKIADNAITSSNAPRDIDTIEWFASPADICHAFAGLTSLQSEPGLSPINTILSTNNGGIELKPTTWPRIWFKGGSEPGVLTLGYLARDNDGKTYVVVMMLANPRKVISSSSTLLGLGVVTGALNLLRG